MKLKVQCDHCNKMLNATKEHLGKRLKCPSCKQAFVVKEFNEDDMPEVVVTVPHPKIPSTPVPASPTSSSMEVEVFINADQQQIGSRPVTSSPFAENPQTTAADKPDTIPVASLAPDDSSTPVAAAVPPTAAASQTPQVPRVRTSDEISVNSSAAAVSAIPAELFPDQGAAAILAYHSHPGADHVIATLNQSFHGQIEPVKSTEKYRFALAGVTLFMILLPMIYVGIILCLIWMVLSFYIHFPEPIPSSGGRGGFLSLILFLAPAVIGPIVILFMIKPIFARPEAKRGRSVSIHAEPVLFEFVRRVCLAVGAPFPSRIDVDYDMNASAGFRHGFKSMFGDDLVLTIGVSMVIGLDMQQFAGVLAHEFGHFSQNAGMRLSHIIRSINLWFARVVYERDAWDAWLVQASHSLDIRLTFPLWIARFCVFLNRRILWVLMMCGHGVSSILLRQMEFDADRYEARMVGGKVFESTCYELQRLGASYRTAMEDSVKMLSANSKLADDFPLLMIFRRGRLPQHQIQHIDAAVAYSKTGFFDTHPADRERIASAHKEQTDGVFQNTLPASTLFMDFERLSKNVTQDMYSQLLGTRLPPDRLVSVREIIARASGK